MPLDTAETTAKAIDAKAGKPKAKRAAKRRTPKLHRPKKESTKTITTRLYRLWAEIVHARYNGKCAVCGRENSKEAPLNAHHIMPRQMFTGLRFNPWNGISLCPRCHKMGKFSAHKGGIWFAEWLRTHDKTTYDYCLAGKDTELDCKSRAALYSVENMLHDAYGDVVAPLTSYHVTAYDRNGSQVGAVLHAYNNRAAEFIFWNSWPKTETPLKGICRTDEEKSAGSFEAHLSEVGLDKSSMDDQLRGLSADDLGKKLTALFCGLDPFGANAIPRTMFVYRRWCLMNDHEPTDFCVRVDRNNSVFVEKQEKTK